MAWEKLQCALSKLASEWDIVEYEFDIPPKEVVPKDRLVYRENAPGDYMKITIYIKRRVKCDE